MRNATWLLGLNPFAGQSRHTESSWNFPGTESPKETKKGEKDPLSISFVLFGQPQIGHGLMGSGAAKFSGRFDNQTQSAVAAALCRRIPKRRIFCQGNLAKRRVADYLPAELRLDL